MPPEQPPFLAILDVSIGTHGVSGRVEYVEPRAESLRVRWGAGSPPKGYTSKGGGVVFVSGQRARSSTKPPDEAPNLTVDGDRLVYSEGYNDANWMMLVVVLPDGYDLVDADPPPAGSRLHHRRLAKYWRFLHEPDTIPTAQIVGALRPLKDLGDSLDDVARPAAIPFDPADEEPLYQVFLSYRRRDDQWAAGRLHRGLADHMGEDAVFRDVSSIDAGRDFRAEIDRAIGQCKAVLVVMGPYWLDPDRPISKRRVDEPNDWPRLELESALQRHKAVIPVLLDDTKMPDPQFFPEQIREVAYRHSVQVREDRFDDDLVHLVRCVSDALSRQ